MQKTEHLKQSALVLLNWYLQNRRNLPWRENQDPYRILVSEFMLQQTRVEAVIPKYLMFLQKFPSLKSLSQATLNDVLESWQGLGYYSRARNLQAACQKIESMGYFPHTIEELEKLPGLGPYTARAVASIAFNKVCAVVDGNVQRVIARLFASEPEKLLQAGQTLSQFIETHFFADQDPSSFNQAMMELGALICTPKNPKCNHCCLKQDCLALRSDLVGYYPRPKIKPEKKEVWLYLALPANGQTLCLTLQGWKGYQPGFAFPYWLESDKELDQSAQICGFEQKWGLCIKNLVLAGHFNHNITNHKMRCLVLASKDINYSDLTPFDSPSSTLLTKSLKIASYKGL